MGWFSAQQPVTDALRARVEALAQPMPGHEVASVDFDTRWSLSPAAAKAALGVVAALAAVVALVVLTGAVDSGGGEQGAEGLIPAQASVQQSGSGGGAGSAPSSPGATGAGGHGSQVGAGRTGTPGGAGAGGDGGAGPGADGAGEVVVSVQGRVERPGLLRVPGTLRVGDVVDRARPQPGANLTGINLAHPVQDGMQLLIDDAGSSMQVAGAAPGAAAGGTPGSAAGSAAGNAAAGTGARTGVGSGGSHPGPPEAGARGVQAPGAGSPGPLVNLNTADAAQLQTLSGVGPATAEAIIAWRTTNGPFRSVEQLMDVKGIGPAKFEAIRGGVTV